MVIYLFPRSKRAWIKIVEVFISVLLMAGVLIIILEGSSAKQNEISLEISKKQFTILRNIELDNELRGNILNSNIPSDWTDLSIDLRNRITSLSPIGMECQARICSLSETCFSSEFSGGNVYAESVVISADLDTYSPRQLKLFCREE